MQGTRRRLCVKRKRSDINGGIEMIKEGRVYLKAIKRVRCPFKKEDGSEFKKGQDPGSCPCMTPLPCEIDIRIPLENFKMNIGA